MISISTNLLLRRRLQFRLKRRSDRKETPLIPNLGEVRRAKKGNKVSRFFRLLFEHAKIKKFLGANLAVLIFATTFFPQPATSNFEAEDSPNTTSPVVLKTQKGIQNPVKTAEINQGHHFFHPGVDFEGTTGESVHPIMDGVVEETKFSSWGYGNSVLVDHGNKTHSLYAHLSEIEVKKGQEVTKSTKLGEVGATGWSTGDHLHLEIREDGRPVNPSAVLPVQ